MKTPKLYQWKLDAFPPIETKSFLSIGNVLELLNAYQDKVNENHEMYEALKDYYNELRKHPEILDDKLYKQYQKIGSLLNEIGNES